MNFYELEKVFIDILSKAKDEDEIEMMKEHLLCDVADEIDMAFEWVMDKNGWYEEEGE